MVVVVVMVMVVVVVSIKGFLVSVQMNVTIHRPQNPLLLPSSSRLLGNLEYLE